MENWQLTLVVLASVFVGALIPVLVTMAIAFYRIGREIAAIGPQLTRTLGHVEIISDRVESLSRGLRGGDKDIADVLSSVGDLARGLERNMKIINIFSAIMASVGPAVAAWISARLPADDAGTPHAADAAAVPENGKSPVGSAVPPDTTRDAHQGKA